MNFVGYWSWVVLYIVCFYRSMAKLKRVKRAARKPWKQITGKAKKKTKRGIHYCLAFNNPSVLYFNEAFFDFLNLSNSFVLHGTIRKHYAKIMLH